MKVMYDRCSSFWDDKSREIISSTYNRDIHLFGATTKEVAKPSIVIIHECGSVSRYKLKFNHTSFIRFLCRWKVQNGKQNGKYEIKVAVEDK
jgi:hypothetical protein